MRMETTPDLTTPRALQQLQQPLEPDVPRCELVARSPDLFAEQDATLLLAALEALEAQRAAIEWLRDADLLRFCLV